MSLFDQMFRNILLEQCRCDNGNYKNGEFSCHKVESDHLKGLIELRDVLFVHYRFY